MAPLHTAKPRNQPLKPWSRLLTRLDGIHASSSGRTYRPSLPPPPPARDPLAILPLSVVSEIMRYVEPRDVVALQRVSKQWRVVLASEYIYTLALKAHFPEEEETQQVWELHAGGVELFPEEAVDGYRKVARRCSQRKVGGSQEMAGGSQEDGEEIRRECQEEEGEEIRKIEEEDGIAGGSFVEEPQSQTSQLSLRSSRRTVSRSPSPPRLIKEKRLVDDQKDLAALVEPEGKQLRLSQESALNRSPRGADKACAITHRKSPYLSDQEDRESTPVVSTMG